MADFTPGPWKYDRNLGCKVIKGGKSGAHKQAQYMEIACTYGLADEAADEANASVIAAAPELLEALQLGVEIYRAGGSFSSVGRERGDEFKALAEAAIAKATTP